MPLTRRQTFLRRRVAFFGSLAVVLAAVVYLANTGLAPIPAIAAEQSTPASLTQPAAQPTWPASGESAIGAVGFPGVLGSAGPQKSVPIASVTKIVTSLVVLDKKPLTGTEPGPTITFTDADVAIYYKVVAMNGSVAPVVSGMKLSEREALTAMLLPSANNYSVSLGVWAYGSMDAYLAAASAWLKAHGMTGTTVADTSGISPASRSTPADLVELGKLVVANPALASIVAQPAARLPIIGIVQNTNKLLGHDGITGMKTGTTDAAGACLLFSANVTVGSRTVTLVGVALGGRTHPELDRAVTALIDSVKPGFRNVTLTKKGASYGTYRTVWGQTSRVVTAKEASVLVWSDTPVSATAKIRKLTLGKAGDRVGAVDFTIGDRSVSVPLLLARTVSDPGPAWRVSHPGELSAGR